MDVMLSLIYDEYPILYRSNYPLERKIIERGEALTAITNTLVAQNLRVYITKADVFNRFNYYKSRMKLVYRNPEMNIKDGWLRKHAVKYGTFLVSSHDNEIGSEDEEPVSLPGVKPVPELTPQRLPLGKLKWAESVMPYSLAALEPCATSKTSADFTGPDSSSFLKYMALLLEPIKRASTMETIVQRLGA